MKRMLDIENWARKDHFRFFKQFEEPFHGVCVDVDCTATYNFAKQNKYSFFLCYLYNVLHAVQLSEPFKLRIEGDDVAIYDEINVSTTVGREDGSFGFGYIDWHANFEKFIEEASAEIKRVRSTTGLELSPCEDIIRFSSLPWIDFTSLSHARVFSVGTSCPNISVGKMTEHNGRKKMPVSIHVNHALVDGLHVGQYIDCLQELMNKKEY